jgi:nicotinate-nucleotide--dimethylbenzimidazole phosphoribosyltransferase
MSPDVSSKAVVVFAGDHGVVAEGVSAYPQQISLEMVRCFLLGGAGINAICRQVGAQVRVVDMGLLGDIDSEVQKLYKDLSIRKIAPGTNNCCQGPAMSLEQARESILAGFDEAKKLIQQGVTLLGTGDMGIGNTTPSTAIGAVLTQSSLETMVGPGTGLDLQGMEIKRKAIDRALERNQPQAEDGLDVLAKVGGFEIGAIAGYILGGALYQVPVVIDGFISTAGALIAQSLCPHVVGYLFAGHCSKEPGHSIMLDHLGLRPILDLGMRLGEGTGGALAMDVIETGVRVFREVLTFEQASVSNKT